MPKEEFESQDARDDVGIFIHSELDDYGLNPLEFRVYGRLARRAGRKGTARQSVPHMAEEFCVRKRTVQRALQVLVLSGLTDAQIRPGRPTVYSLNPRRKWKSYTELQGIRERVNNPKRATLGTRVVEPEGCATTDPGVRHEGPGGATLGTCEGTPMKVLPEEGTPSLRSRAKAQPKPRRGNIGPAEVALPYSGVEYREAWEDFEVHRVEIRTPLGAKQREPLLEQLATVDEPEGIKLIRDTIRKGYRNFDWHFNSQNGNGADGKSFENRSQRNVRLISRRYGKGAIPGRVGLNHHAITTGAIPSTTGRPGDGSDDRGVG